MGTGKGYRKLMRDEKKSKWGVGLFLLYGGFVIFILMLALYASMHDMQMVEENYYQKDLTYQDQIERMKRANIPGNEIDVKISPHSKNIQVVFPASMSENLSGTIKLFRPSNAELDFEIPIECNTMGVQEIETRTMAAGLWKIKIKWTSDTTEYFSESRVIIE